MRNTTYKGFTIENVSDYLNLYSDFKVSISHQGFDSNNIYTNNHYFASELEAKKFITETLKHGEQENIEYFQREV